MEVPLPWERPLCCGGASWSPWGRATSSPTSGSSLVDGDAPTRSRSTTSARSTGRSRARSPCRARRRSWSTARTRPCRRSCCAASARGAARGAPGAPRRRSARAARRARPSGRRWRGSRRTAAPRTLRSRRVAAALDRRCSASPIGPGRELRDLTYPPDDRDLPEWREARPGGYRAVHGDARSCRGRARRSARIKGGADRSRARPATAAVPKRAAGRCRRSRRCPSPTSNRGWEQYSLRNGRADAERDLRLHRRVRQAGDGRLHARGGHARHGPAAPSPAVRLHQAVRL